MHFYVTQTCCRSRYSVGDRISCFHISQNENPIVMDDRGHSFIVRTLLLMGIAVLVSAQEDIDMDLFLFLSSQMSPPPECPEFELYNSCSGNCSDCARRGACRADCSVQGCECLPNYARLEPGGPCQPVHLCPVPECGENEVFRECGAACERCGGLRCRILQCEHRCYCAQGHLRDDQGKCVPEEQCPKVRCFRNEELRSGGGREDEFCQRDEGTSNATDTRERCYCKEGHSRDALGLCVPDEHCERVRCPGAEVWRSCPRKCGVSCRGDSGGCREDGQCFPGCFCPDGFLVDDFRRCVPEDQCPQTEGSSPFSLLSTEPTDSPITLMSEVQVSCSSPALAMEGCGGKDESQPTGEEDAEDTPILSTNTTEVDDTTPNFASTQETTPSPAATTKQSTPAVDTSTTAQETTADEATTTTSATPIPPPDEEENDF